MNSTVVKDPARLLSLLFRRFGAYVRSNKIRDLARKSPNDFSRIRKFPWYDVLFYLIFRCEKCTSSEISKYFSDIALPHLRISKQAAFKALKKVNPNVFLNLIHAFAVFFYDSALVKTYKGFILLAEDGTSHELRPTDESLDRFGFIVNQFIRCKDDALKATSRSAALYDVTNGLIVDFSMNPYKKSEIPIAIDHLINSHSLFEGRNVVYLADRYYGSLELFALLESYGFHYCIRGKSNFFKKYVSQMKSNDEWIEIMLDKPWLKRLKYAHTKDRFNDNPTFRIRVVKHSYSYDDIHGNTQYSDLIYFTNLNQSDFNTHEIVELYAKRWDIECTYKTLKSDYEWERFFSEDCECEMCSIYAKVIYHNMVGIIRKELNSILADECVTTKVYVTNIVQLSCFLRANHICRWIRSLNINALERLIRMVLKLVHKIKVPIRADRHNQRWGRWVSSSSPYRFRLDGRNWPKVAYMKGHLQTMKP